MNFAIIYMFYLKESMIREFHEHICKYSSICVLQTHRTRIGMRYNSQRYVRNI